MQQPSSSAQTPKSVSPKGSIKRGLTRREFNFGMTAAGAAALLAACGLSGPNDDVNRTTNKLWGEDLLDPDRKIGSVKRYVNDESVIHNGPDHRANVDAELRKQGTSLPKFAWEQDAVDYFSRDLKQDFDHAYEQTHDRTEINGMYGASIHIIGGRGTDAAGKAKGMEVLISPDGDKVAYAGDIIKWVQGDKLWKREYANREKNIVTRGWIQEPALRSAAGLSGRRVLISTTLTAHLGTSRQSSWIHNYTKNGSTQVFNTIVSEPTAGGLGNLAGPNQLPGDVRGIVLYSGRIHPNPKLGAWVLDPVNDGAIGLITTLDWGPLEDDKGVMNLTAIVHWTTRDGVRYAFERLDDGTRRRTATGEKLPDLKLESENAIREALKSSPALATALLAAPAFMQKTMDRIPGVANGQLNQKPVTTLAYAGPWEYLSEYEDLELVRDKRNGLDLPGPVKVPSTNGSVGEPAGLEFNLTQSY